MFFSPETGAPCIAADFDFLRAYAGKAGLAFGIKSVGLGDHMLDLFIGQFLMVLARQKSARNIDESHRDTRIGGQFAAGLILPCDGRVVSENRVGIERGDHHIIVGTFGGECRHEPDVGLRRDEVPGAAALDNLLLNQMLGRQSL